MHAQKKEFVGPAQLSREMNSWPEARFHREWQVVSPRGETLPDLEYEILRADGAIIRGRTDEHGRIPRQKGTSFESMKLRVRVPERSEVKDD